MLQVLVAGFIALGSKWLLEGGIRRRDRHVIREELELADLLGEAPEADLLRDAAHRRLRRYLRPPFVRRAANARVAWLAGAAVLGVAVATVAVPSDSEVIVKIVSGLVIGLLAGTLSETTEALTRLRLRKESLLVRRKDLLERQAELRAQLQWMEQEARRRGVRFDDDPPPDAA